MSEKLPKMPEPKPCPFCGQSHTLKLTTAEEVAKEGEGDSEPWEHSPSWAVVCDASRPYGPGGCGASGGYFPTEDEAIAAWNRRSLQRDTWMRAMEVAAELTWPSLPEIKKWSKEEALALLDAESQADERGKGHYETLFSIAAAALKNRAAAIRALPMPEGGE